MNCPITNKPCNKPKTIHVTDIINGEPQKFELCDECGVNLVQDLNIKKTENAKTLLPPNLTSIISMIDKLVQENTTGLLTYKCTSCGLTFEALNKISRFGCANCYTYYNEIAVELLARCQVGLTHIGKIPTNIDSLYPLDNVEEKIVLLKSELQKAIEIENYEMANSLKKKIEELENEGGHET